MKRVSTKIKNPKRKLHNLVCLNFSRSVKDVEKTGIAFLMVAIFGLGVLMGYSMGFNQGYATITRQRVRVPEDPYEIQVWQISTNLSKLEPELNSTEVSIPTETDVVHVIFMRVSFNAAANCTIRYYGPAELFYFSPHTGEWKHDMMDVIHRGEYGAGGCTGTIPFLVAAPDDTRYEVILEFEIETQDGTIYEQYPIRIN